MIVRIVKLTFKKENIASFEQLFEETKDKIRSFKGCSFLELYQDSEHPGIFFTYSYWQSTEALESYRKSDFFKKVWGETKKMFENQPQAWTVNKIQTLD
ncbi:MAG: putative quinol monooxygenase [Flavobacteriaceae bacterium]